MTTSLLRKLSAAHVRDCAFDAISGFSYDRTDSEGNVLASYSGVDGFFQSMAEGPSVERIALLNFIKAIAVAELKIADAQNARKTGLIFSMDLE